MLTERITEILQGIASGNRPDAATLNQLDTHEMTSLLGIIGTENLIEDPELAAVIEAIQVDIHQARNLVQDILEKLKQLTTTPD